jgi:hypothetical protein
MELARFRPRLFLAAGCAAALCAGGAAAGARGEPRATAARPVVHEERQVRIGGHTELWRLEWEKPPLPACEAGDPMWFTCPCAGFAFGERGLLDLVRLRDSKEVERLPLTPLFAEEIVTYGAVAILRRVEPR